MKYSKNSIKMKDVNQQMNDYYNAVMKLNGVSNEDGISKGIKPTDLTMRDINAGVTIPYYGEREGGNSLTTMCMSCDTGIATTRLHKNCHVEHEDLELTVAAYQTLVDKKGSMIIDVDAEDDDLHDEDEQAQYKHIWPACIGQFPPTHCKKCASALSTIEPSLKFLTNMAGCWCGVEAKDVKHGKHKCYYCTENSKLSNKNIVVRTLTGLKKALIDEKKREVTCPYCQTSMRVIFQHGYTSAAGAGTRGCKVDWCNKRCIKFDNTIGKWDSVRADVERARLANKEMSSDKREGLIATAAGRCIGKRPERKITARQIPKICNSCFNATRKSQAKH